MSDLGPIVVDRHAYKLLWPALGVWLLLFITAGDAWTVLRRQAAHVLRGAGFAALWLWAAARRRFG